MHTECSVRGSNEISSVIGNSQSVKPANSPLSHSHPVSCVHTL